MTNLLKRRLAGRFYPTSYWFRTAGVWYYTTNMYVSWPETVDECFPNCQNICVSPVCKIWNNDYTKVSVLGNFMIYGCFLRSICRHHYIASVCCILLSDDSITTMPYYANQLGAKPICKIWFILTKFIVCQRHSVFLIIIGYIF